MSGWHGALAHAEALYCAEPVSRVDHAAGHDDRCDFCGRTILAAETECEIEARIGAQHTALRFHPACREAWDATRRLNYL
jgi:hypothetical protein